MGTLGRIDTPSWVTRNERDGERRQPLRPGVLLGSRHPEHSTLGVQLPRVLVCAACRHYCAAEGEGRAGAGEPTPQRSRGAVVGFSDPWRDLRTGIAAGPLPALPATGRCADPRGPSRGPRQAVSATGRPQGPPEALRRCRSACAPPQALRRPLRPRCRCIRAPSRPPQSRQRECRPGDHQRPGPTAQRLDAQPYSASTPRSFAAHNCRS